MDEYEGFTVEGARKHLDTFKEQLSKLVPDPATTRFLIPDKEYMPVELRDFLQLFGGYLGTLYPIEAQIKADCHIVKEGLKTGLSVAMVNTEGKYSTVKDKESTVLAGNEILLHYRKLQIENEACLELISGWVKAYDALYTAVSRIISIQLGELTLNTGRHA